MKKIQGLFVLLAFLLMGVSASLHAEDTDIYVDNGTNVGVPNVLFVLYNGADMDADAGNTCTYTDGTVPSTGGNKVISLLQCSLVSAIAGLANGSVNIGVAVNNFSDGASQLTTNQALGGYHDLCQSGSNGGCIVRNLMNMDTTGKASMTAFIKGLKKFTGGSTATDGVALKVNASSGDPASAMQEAWAYYNGKIGGSGKSYASSIVGSGCQRNFVVYIGSSAKGTTGTGNQAMNAAQVGATTAQLTEITGTVKFVPSICGQATQTLSSGNNWADEWARLMYQQDGGASGNSGTQNITTYAINVQAAPNKCFPDTPAMLSSMAKVGGGKFYDASSAPDLTTALSSILNEVQAVNSVFSSASLPVSVNAEGSYLNQIYLGMFRPDSSGAPRWMGNLKQYQLVKNSAGALVMGDSTGAAAISSAGTGFITPNAVSFWSKKDTTKAPDTAAIGGFWVNDKKGVPESAYDSPDGEVVEKGGVAQQLRLESLTADFTGAGGTTNNPRRMYTYCPNGSSCIAALTDTANQFSTANGAISAAAFGASTTVKINSIVRTGTTALVTTNGSHGFTTGATVTISNAGQTEYNVTQAVTVNSGTTFTITGLPDYPTTPSAGTYTLSAVGGTGVAVSSITRATSTSGSKNSETVTLVTSSAHLIPPGSNITITGASTADVLYNNTFASTAVSTNSITFAIPIYPPTAPTGTYKAATKVSSYPSKSVTLAKYSANVVGGTTSSAHGFWVGQSVTVGDSTVGSKYTGTFTLTGVGTNTFTYAVSALGSPSSVTGTVQQDASSKAVTLTRVATTAAATATATGAPANFFGTAIGNTRIINMSATTPGANEGAYLLSNSSSDITITCANATCTSFTYPITVTPSVSPSGSMLVALAGAINVNVAAGGITRTTAGIATVTGVTAGVFTNGQNVIIGASGSALSSESAYVGTWPITCTAPCTSFTFGPVTLTPTTPASGSNMQAYSGATPPDRDTVIKWLRGSDNYGDEKGPGGTITVRPSVHGDVLHSRPLVINYGDTRGIVVFYGSNDGLYRAINGNQTTAMGSVAAGGELWSLILPEHYNEINRLRLNSPELKFPSTVLATALLKDYFVDGATGAYQKLKADGTIDKAILFLTMRRGGNFLYAVDVSTPTAPTVLWKITNSTAGFEELGQTWSRPRVTLLQSSGLQTTPVVVFGAGYDSAEDSEPPATDTMGRGIYVVNAETGALVWSATPSCTTSATCLNVPGMTYAIPADIAFVDRDNNGYTDKFYFGDLGGNVWRADVNTALTTGFKVTKLAALGCNTGQCASGTTPRKFFFPPSVLSIKTSGAAGSFDAISLASGDREHPLKSTATGSAYNVSDRFFMILDTGTTVGVTATANVTPAATDLRDATSSSYEYDGSLKGFYKSFATGEKGVNAPLAVNGFVFFATNRPTDPLTSCAANLGEAKGYAVSPFLATTTSNILAGGGLAPSPVSGLISVTTNGVTSEEKFCIGCAMDCTGSTCSALENSPPPISVPKNMRRTYWYRK